MTPVPVFTGGRGTLLAALATCVVGLLLTGLGFVTAPRETLWSWLFAFVHWSSLWVSALLLLATLHVTGARWGIVFRRVLEVMALSGVVLVPLFLPVVLGSETLFAWRSPPTGLDAEALGRLQHKGPWLNLGAFVARALLYFLVWTVIAGCLARWSRQQDESGDPRLASRQRTLSGPALPLVGLLFSFAALDWVMSVEPMWKSTIFALYLFSGAFASVLALLAIVAGLGQRTSLFAGLLGPAHFQALGNLILGMCAFWAYMAFSQYMLTWIANLPDGVTWYRTRTSGTWTLVALAVPLAQFALPFFPLLFRSVKRSPHRLVPVAACVVFAHALDVYWTLLPTAFPHGAHLHWTLFTAFAGMGGATVAFAVWRLRGGYALPVGDPHLLHSLQLRP